MQDWRQRSMWREPLAYIAVLLAIAFVLVVVLAIVFH